MIRPEGYPKINITFDSFCNQLIKCFTDNVFNKNELNDFYITYKEHQYKSNLDWVKEVGYESVRDWAKVFFQQWNKSEHRTMLKFFVPKLGKWFLSDDIKPESHLPVLVFVPLQDDLICIATWQKRNEWMEIYSGDLIKGEVTHWSKLPNKPNIK